MFRNRKTPQSRKGTEIVELAIAMPLLTVVIFGVLETCEVLFLRQSASIACYEATRVATRRGGTPEAARTRCEALLTGRRVSDATVTVTPEDFSGLPQGTPVTVSVTIPFSENRTTGLVIDNELEIAESTTMVIE